MPKPSGLSGALSKRIHASQDGAAAVDKAYDEMFGLKIGGGNHDHDKIVELDLSLVKPHPQDPFKPYAEDKLKELADSIAKIGLLDPINVRPCGDGTYEILAGKNRSNAARMNGDKKIKAIVRDIDDDIAIMIITDSNLKHREKLLPSEKAFAYKLQLDAIKKQGKRLDLEENSTSVEIQQKLGRNIVAEINNIKDNEVQRYIRLTSLIPELLDLVDSEEIPLMAGVDLSHIDVQSQTTVYHYFFILHTEIQLDIKISTLIKAAFKEGKSSITTAKLSILLKQQQKKKKSKPFAINRNKFKDFADKLPDDQELESLFIEFLKARFGG
jgi:ParB family chromosome partitioning protein